MFERFWKEADSPLEPGQAQVLERLLALPDNDLLDLVMGRTESPDREFRDLVKKLRAA